MCFVTCGTTLYTFDQSRVPVWTLDVQIGIHSMIYLINFLSVFPIGNKRSSQLCKGSLISWLAPPILTGQRWLACQSGPGDI